MGLNKEQQAAVEYLDGPLLVLAGPGTGKTQLLSAKVAYILEHTDANPSDILCLTFTESGASNMRERLGTMVGRSAKEVNIYTYHAFGSNVIERYKNYAENFDRRLDSVIDEVTQHKFIRLIQQNLPVTNILKTAEIGSLVETIQKAKSAQLSADDLEKIAKQNLTDSQKISELATDILQQLRPREKFNIALETVYQPLLEALSQLADPQPITKNIERSANLLVRELEHIITETSSRKKPSVAPLSKWKKDNFEIQEDGSYRLKDYIANKKLLALSEIMRAYDESLRAEGLFDFADMIQEAIRALREDRGFRLSLSENFQYILLDEFQDTNPSQFEIIKLLTDYENPIVMAVGDDDQAIYEFQGASASNLLDFQNYYNAKVITLLDNYRSTGEILAFSHRVAEQVNDSFAKHHGVAKILRSMMDVLSGKSTQEPQAQVSRHEFLSANDEYYWIAEQISQLISAGEEPTNIAIIAPKHKYIGPLLPYLKAKDIDIAYEKRSNLLEDSKIGELVILARFVSDLMNEKQPSHRLLEILSFPFLQVPSIVAIQSICKGYNDTRTALDYLLSSEDAKLQQIAQWLSDLVVEAYEAPLELWLDYLIGARPTPMHLGENSQSEYFASPFLTYYSTHSEPAEQLEFYQNLNALRGTVSSHTHNTRPKLADFIAMLDDYEAAGASIMSTSPYQDSSRSVQVMSAHKSKGLEFKYVFMIAVDDMAWGKAKGNNNLFKLPNNLAQIRHTGITDDEQLRLLFVAITRAKQYLIMTNSVQDFADKKNARLSYLNEQRDEKAEVQLSPYLAESAQAIRLHYDDFDIDTRIDANRYGWTANYQVMTPDLRALLKARLENYRMTATDLTTFIDIIYAGPEAIYRSRVLCAPDEPLTTQLAYGNLIHSVFEQVTNQKISDDEALALFLEKVDDLPLSRHDITELKAKGEHDLVIALHEFQDILRHTHGKAEVNLSSEHLILDSVPLTGKIDHLNINPETKTIEIYDFKTGNYKDSKWQSHPTLYKYAMQLGFYKLLLNLSPTYRNYRVTRGHILFVSPDNDEKVYDKAYEYDDASETELKNLIKVIYQQIVSLDFVDNPEINLPADKKNTIRQIKEFVDKLLTLQ